MKKKICDFFADTVIAIIVFEVENPGVNENSVFSYSGAHYSIYAFI